MWEQYERWNSAIADEVFSADQTGLPVYLDLEEDLLNAVAARVGSSTADPAVDLVSAVRATIGARAGRAGVFARHNGRLRAWERDPAAEPPHLALLAVCSLAAERMASGEGYRSDNYYGRLAPMLGMDGRLGDLAHAYRSHAERWWTALNTWLEIHDGRRGLPTAFTLTGTEHRYVGLAISQALVRTADRQSLVRFFRSVGFAPGSDVTPGTLMPLLDAWIGQQPTPATRSLQRIWSRAATRPRVAEVAAVALASWDGAVDGGKDGVTSDEHLRLFATLGGFFRERFEVGVLAYLEHPDVARDVRVVDVAGSPTVAAVPTTVGAMRLAGMEQADLGSLLNGVLTIEDGLTGRRASRRPRRVVPLRMDDLLQQLIEADLVQAGEDVVVLLNRDLLPDLSRLLTEVARPGWSIAEGVDGVPERWALVRGVQILRSPSQPCGLDLRSLIPPTQSQLKLAGGFAIPGRIRRWHSAMPPEIRAIDDGDRPTTVRITRLGVPDADADESPIHAVMLDYPSGAGEVTVIDTAALGLGDGDYRVDLHRNGDEAPVTSQMLRLRSGDTRDILQWQLAPELGHASRLGISMLGAVDLGPDDGWIRGAIACDEPLLVGREGRVPRTPWWESELAQPPPSKEALWQIAPADADSCMLTGAHYVLLPDARPGRPLSKFIDGRCRGCGLIRRVPTTAWAARKKPSRTVSRESASLIDVRTVVPVRSEAVNRRWEIALDTLQYLGGGEYGLLERAALQIDGSGLSVDAFVRTLETLGHIEVSRNNELRGERWEIAPTALAQRSDGSWSLVGYWPAGILSDLQTSVRGAGGEVYVVNTAEGLPLYHLETLGNVVPKLDGLDGVAVVPRAAHAMASQLRPLSELVAALPRRSDALVGAVRRFSPQGARWMNASGIGSPGAYRVKRWADLDIVRTRRDIEDHTVARSTVQLSKHVAALDAGRPLVSYVPDTGDLVVPLGADLPGLYGRTATLASGEPPVVDRRARRLVYRSVPPEVAEAIVRCLGS